MSEHLSKVIDILHNVPGFAGIKESDVKSTRLGGLTNLGNALKGGS